MTPITLPSGTAWSVRTLRRSAALEAMHVRDRLTRQAAQATRVSRDAFAAAKTLEGDAALDADDQGAEAIIRATRLVEAANGWVIQAVWTGEPLGPTQGPEATGSAMLDLLDRLGWSEDDVAYLASASLLALCVPQSELPAKLAKLGTLPAEKIAVEGARETAASDAAVIAEVAETIPFSEARAES